MNKILSVLLLTIPLCSFADIEKITQKQCQEMYAANTITKENPVQCNRLNKVTFDYINFDGDTNRGEIVVLDVFAPQVERLFKNLYVINFPLYKSQPLEDYKGDDNASMADNNTSAFNGRKITDDSGWSKHSYGAAIDINPVQNPYLSFHELGIINVNPPKSFQQYINRLNQRPGKEIRKGLAEEVRDIFFSHGFLRWGGYWDSPIDYQHFEVGSYDYIEKLMDEPLFSAQEEFKKYGEAYSDCMAQSDEKNQEAKIKLCVDKTLK